MESLYIEKAIIIGLSLGGGVALEMAIQYPEKVEKIVLLCGISAEGVPIM